MDGFRMGSDCRAEKNKCIFHLIQQFISIQFNLSTDGTQLNIFYPAGIRFNKGFYMAVNRGLCKHYCLTSWPVFFFSREWNCQYCESDLVSFIYLLQQTTAFRLFWPFSDAIFVNEESKRLLRNAITLTFFDVDISICHILPTSKDLISIFFSRVSFR
jgi:hypothetical protein